jgi:catechol 2,3-dioxygenase-like lactoylglutathione lyase family enzyme
VAAHHRGGDGGLVKLGAFSVSLTVADLDASRRFYEHLGFEVTGGDADENWLIMVNGDTVIGLFHGMFDDNILTFNPGLTQQKEQLSEFTDVRDIQAALLAAGVELLDGTDPDGTGPAHIVLTDPDGNRIMVDQFFDRPGE